MKNLEAKILQGDDCKCLVVPAAEAKLVSNETQFCDMRDENCNGSSSGQNIMKLIIEMTNPDGKRQSG